MSTDPFELPEIGTLADLLPAFEFDCLIAQGGMGAVYKARQRSLDRDVAIKILPRELGDDPLFRNSFQAEARAMARLTHPNLIKIYDSGDLDGLLYIVMEYVPGKSLFHSAHGKAIEPQQAVEIVLAACHGLAHAHGNEIVHRDIKPANILLTPKCEPKIGDFGLSRCTRTRADGLAMGTPAYMAPEVIEHPETGDRQSDVFAIGVVLRELLTGIPAGTADATRAVISDPMLTAICRKATHVDPALRYPDAPALAAQLRHWIALKTARSTVTTAQAAARRPKPAVLTRRATSANRALLKNCAIITFLLCAIYLTWGVYQGRLEAIARQQQSPSANPSVKLAKAEPEPAAVFTPSRDLVAALSEVKP